MSSERLPAGARLRMTALLVALADDPEGLRRDWILRNVRGYDAVSHDSADRYLREDVPVLRALGISVAWDRADRLVLDRRSFRLDDPGFTEDEADVLAMATRVTFDDDSMKELISGGWAKLAPVAQRSSLTGDRATVIIGDRVSLDGAQFTDLTRATQPPRKRVEFYYAPQLFAEEVPRTLEPWSIVNLRGRWYVVGHDVDRDAVRAFRMTRITDVTVTDVDAAIPIPDEDLQDIAERALNRGAAPVRGVVTLCDADELPAVADVLAGAEARGDATWELGPMSTTELIDIGLEHAGVLTVDEPAEVREAIVDKLRAIVSEADHAGDAATDVADPGEENR
ncbi:YafY family protein [uncultured Corynebacterium sp.]|uniref:helix-turn-helix transcriptional regulator n=1 Tax=uncultured Corynebacterium sp. TaxID=159447 RepID=UPI0025DE09C9|nr:WYL domain-containing protein [uncultured Corynebacterium sp.]